MHQLQIDYMKQETFLGLDRRGQNKAEALAGLEDGTNTLYYLTAEGIYIRITFAEVDGTGAPVE
jgi:hypothetical protein